MKSQLQRCSARQNAITLLFAIICMSQLLPGALAQTEPPKTAADYYVKSLPGAPDGPLLKMHAGHVQVEDQHNGHLFFWHFENRHISDRQRTVIWLNGGPGCSSEDGAMMEIGPYRVAEEGKLVYNNGSWDEFANLLFVDNPIGTGYSYVDGNGYIHELQTMADQFIVFLEKWFAIFPQYEFDDLYISGESYAGQHIPYIAKAILDRNARSGVRPWNLMGLLIGNGWISPIDQYPSYLKMAYDSGLVVKDSHEAQILETKQAVCLSKLKEPDGEHVDVILCEAILTDLLRMTSDRTKPDDQQCVNMYDIRLRDSYPSCGMNWPPDLPAVTTYLRRTDVVSALNLDSAKKAGWTECNGAVGGAFNAAKSTPAVHLLPEILETVPVLLFSGDQDMICNHFGTEALIHSLEWNGGEGFEISPGVWAPKRDWSFEGEPAGTYQAARNLTYVLFYNSSHMVPFDYPRRTRDMLDRFMGVDIASIGGSPQESLIDGEKGLETSVGGHPNSTVATEEEQAALQEAKWNAYYRSGEVVLVIVIIAAGFWFYYIWRDRRQRAGYQGVENNTNNILMGMRNAFSSSASLETAKANGHERRDLEASDFDEAELDRIGNNTEPRERRYDADSISDHEDEKPYRA